MDVKRLRILMKIDNTCHPDVTKGMSRMVTGLGGGTSSPLENNNTKSAIKTWDKAWLICNSDGEQVYDHPASGSSHDSPQDHHDESAFSQLDDSIVSTTDNAPSFDEATNNLFVKILEGNGIDLNLYLVGKYETEGSKLVDLTVPDKWLISRFPQDDKDAQRYL